MALDAQAVQRAIAAEIRAEMARQNLTHAELIRRSGVSQSAYRYYLRTFERDLPMPALLALCDALDMPAADVLERAIAAAAAATE